MEQGMHVILKQMKHVDEEVLIYSKQLGLRGFAYGSPTFLGENCFEFDKLLLAKEHVESYGLVLECIENVPIQQSYKIMLGLEGRDEQILYFQQTIRNMGKAGIPILGYNFMPSMVWRTSTETIGRGGVKVTSYDKSLEKWGNKNKSYIKISDVKISDVEQLWDNYEYFIKAVIPVAEESGVKLALHPDDPPVQEVDGMARLFTSPEAFRRGMEMANSDAWGINLCLGTCSEMLDGPNKIFEMIDYFGSRKRIFYTHMRDVQGHVPVFRECFLGEGNYDPAEVMLALRDVGFKGHIIDDHAPKMINDPGYGFRARGFAVGYLQGMIKMMERTSDNTIAEEL